MEKKKLTFNEYQDFTDTTASYPKDVALYYTALGLAGEAGEYADKVKKVIRDHNGILSDDLILALAKELGDVQWYIAQAARVLKHTLEEIAELNKNKLTNRLKNNTLHGSGDDR